MRQGRTSTEKRQSAADDRSGAGRHYERHLARSAAGRRRGEGIFYTPADLAEAIVERTLRPLVTGMSVDRLRQLRVLDPACGCGVFLLAAYRWLCDWHEALTGGRRLSSALRRTIARRHLAGIDIDPVAVKLATQALAAASDLPVARLADNFRVGDALLDHAEWFRGTFDAVVTNPPYVNIRRLAKSRGAALADAYRRRYRCAAGAFDLYTLFLERSVAALAAGGRIGAIVPNKLATLDYARPCRELLLDQGRLDEIIDVSHLKVFGDADVYPYIVIWTNVPSPRDHAIRVVRPAKITLTRSVSEGLSKAAEFRVLQSRQRADRGLMLGGDLDVESLVPTVPLAQLCSIHSGATGFQATELAARLVEGLDDDPQDSRTECSAFDFIVSGNIDPYTIRLGDVRFIGRKLTRPLLDSDDPILTERKRQLYAGPKIVLAGMCRRLEAALDTRGLALGVQVYALAEWQIDPLYLLGLVNSKLMTHLFRLRFAAKRLAGGYFSLSKNQLAQLPIRILNMSDAAERQQHDRLVSLVRQRMDIPAARRQALASLDAQIDALVSKVYRVAPHELTPLPAAA